MDADGANLRQITSGPDYDLTPAWSPDGEMLAFVRADPAGVNFDIYAIRNDGTDLRRLTTSADLDASPSWSPDGRMIAFQRQHAGNYELYTIDVSTLGEVQLTNHPAVDAQPAWSPDGRRIAFYSTRDPVHPDGTILLLDIATGAIHSFFEDPAIAARPSWSPDGLAIVFERFETASNAGEIYRVGLDGTGSTNISNDAGNDRAPSWGVKALPDLVVSQVSAAFDGTLYDIELVVRNQGVLRVAHDFDVTFYQSDDETLDFIDRHLRRNQDSACVLTVPALPSGGSSALLTVRCLMPSSVVAAAPFVLANVDDGLGVLEGDEANNLAAAHVALPDLVVSQLSAGFDGARYDLQVVVRNQGAANVAAGFEVTFYQSDDDTLDFTDRLLTIHPDSVCVVAGPPLTKGTSSAPLTVSCPKPSNTSGAAFVLAYVDHHLNILESNETNNSAAAGVALPDLVVSQLSAVFNGTSYDIEMVIRNQGAANVAVHSEATFFQSDNEIWEGIDRQLMSAQESACVVMVPPLPAGGSSGPLTVSCLRPSGLGAAFVIAIVDPALNILESNDANNDRAARAPIVGDTDSDGLPDPLDSDDDNDGILDEVDTQPLQFSNDFSDVPQGGRTFGVIVTRGNQLLTVTDRTNSNGVAIIAAVSGGATPASIRACTNSAQYSLVPGSGAVITCGSVTTTVLAGAVEITYFAADGSVATVMLTEGNTLTFEPETATLTAPAANASTTVVESSGIQLHIEPGQTVSVAKQVQLDVKPGTSPNSINLGSAGTVPAAILSTPDFSAPAEVDPESLSLIGAAVNLVGKAGRLQCSSADVNADGLADFVCHFVTADLGLQPGDSAAVLLGRTFGGRLIRGEDVVRVLP
jgi:hypothetical protein